MVHYIPSRWQKKNGEQSALINGHLGGHPGGWVIMDNMLSFEEKVANLLILGRLGAVWGNRP